jgi:hypothetical protein
MEYPVTFYRQGWADLSDWVLVLDAEHEKECRAAGFKHMREFVDVAETQQIGQNDSTAQAEKAPEEAPKRRGRPPRVQP